MTRRARHKDAGLPPPGLAALDALQLRYGGWQDDPEEAVGAGECVRILLDDGLWRAACAEAVRAGAERLREWTEMPCWVVEVVDGAPATPAAARRPVARLVAMVASGTDDEDTLRAAADDWAAARVVPGEAEAPVALQLHLLRSDVRRGRRSRIGVLFDARTDGWTGVAGFLEREVVPGGPRGLFPDPRVLPTLAADADFQHALTTAWRRHRPGPCPVWRLRVEAPWSHHVVGGSLGAAFAVLLEELLGPPRRRRRALTGRLRTPAGARRSPARWTRTAGSHPSAACPPSSPSRPNAAWS